ncbi:MAG TPA: serine hydrolase domain-containing protein [Bryobacteraceae bacterium]|nr:serine hydrolase domain-containing protein [Bryobacteraceae bacterium]
MFDARKLDSAIDQAIAERRIVGTVVLVSHKGEPVYRRAAGLADREAGIAMRPGHIFRLSSLSKPMVSAAVLAMAEQGTLHLDDNVSQWIPEFQPPLPDGTKPEITVRQLLNHTAGLGYGFLEPDDGPYHRANVSDGLDQPGLSIHENLQRIASVPLAYQPGAAWGYSVAHDVLGEVIARASGGTLPEAVRRFVSMPLGIHDTGFTVTDPTRLAVPYADGSPEPVRMAGLQVVKMAYGPGSIRFAPSRTLHPGSYPSGGCGMVGTALDFARFLEALRAGGRPILSGPSVEAMTANQTGGLGPAPGVAFGFGLSVVMDPALTETPQSAGTFGWGGVYGHTWFVDRRKDLTVVALTNTAVEGVSGQFPARVRRAVYADPTLK